MRPRSEGRNTDAGSAGCKRWLGGSRTLEKLSKLLNGQACIAYDATHRVRIDWIRARNGQDSDAIAHDNVLALSDHLKTGLLQSPDGILMIDTRNLGHALGDNFYFAYNLAVQQVVTGS